MSTSCDGVNSESFNKSDNSEAIQDQVFTNDTSEEIFPLEIGFKGFNKTPMVLISRHDITPFLKSRKPTTEAPESSSDKFEHLHRLSQKCSVALRKDDLEKLKKAFRKLKNVPVLKDVSSDSESEILDLNMAVQCNICEKLYATKKKLQKHQSKKHMIVYGNKPQKRVSFSDHVIVHEVKEYHKCRKCTKIFEDYKALKVHMKQQHKKRKCYICNYCDKSFIDRMFFKVHIKLHCDMCGLLLPNRSKYLEHRRLVCRVLKLHKCKTCNDSFFKFMDLKDHSYEHLSTFFICDICKDQFVTKCAVAHHIAFLHSEKRPSSLLSMRILGTERIYLCNFCDETSVDKDYIEVHVGLLPDLANKATTGYTDYYFCDQCLRKFDTETNMLQHKWTHFLKTSDNSQIRPKSILAKKKVKSKTTFKIDEKIPEYFKPNVVLDKITIGGKVLTETVDFVDVKSFDIRNGDIKKAVVDQKSKKTIISKHQCPNCGKYYSTNYCLSRHIETQHNDYERLHCKVCEETFVWPSLLQSHRCIRMNIPEMPFNDARPEVHFDNLHEITHNGFDDLNISENDDYMNSVDFEIPAPIVELTESEGAYIIPNGDVNGQTQLDKSYGSVKDPPLQNLGYKLVMQEVPIEF